VSEPRRRRHRAAAALLALLVGGGFGFPSGGRAQVRRPEVARPEPGRLAFRLSLGLDNDNLLLGLWRLIGEDGDDTGRTHASDLRFAVTRPDGMSFGLQIESVLFLTDNDRPRRVADEDGNWLYRDDDGNQGFLVDDVFVAEDGRVIAPDDVDKVGPNEYVDGRGVPVALERRAFVEDGRAVEDIDVNSARRVQQRRNLPVDFRELTYLRFFADTRARDGAFYWQIHSGVVIRNGRNVTWGATGQQLLWHRLIRWREYDYRPAQEPNEYGLLLGGRVGLDEEVASWSPKARVYGRVRGGAELTTLIEGNRFLGRMELALEGGPEDAPWGDLRVIQDADFYFALPAVLMTSRFQGAVHVVPELSLYLRLNLYWGGLANALFTFNRNRPTTEAGLELRF